MGLKPAVPFGTTLSATTTKLSTAFATAGTNIGKILDQAKLLKVPLTQSAIDDLTTIKTTFAVFAGTYTALGAAFMNSTGPAGAVTTVLADGVKYIDTILPAFGLAMYNLETLTSIKMLKFFPNATQQADLQTSFFNVFTAVLTLADKTAVTVADINGVLPAEDLKVIQSFYDFYVAAMITVNAQLGTILLQFTGLVTVQTALLKQVAPFAGEMTTWNGKVLAASTKTIPLITGALAAELKAEQTAISAIISKLITYIDNDAVENVPGRVFLS